MMTEIFPAPIRGQAMSIAIASQWIANLLVSGTFPLLFGNDTLNGAGTRRSRSGSTAASAS